MQTVANDSEGPLVALFAASSKDSGCSPHRPRLAAGRPMSHGLKPIHETRVSRCRAL
jgi:hypothetical protein